MPSKSSGKRCASISPWRPPLEHEFQYDLRRRAAVVVLRDVLRRRGREVHRAVGVVDRLLRVAHHERRRRAPCASRGRCSSARRRTRAAAPGCAAPTRPASSSDFAGVAAVADHVEAAVPLRRQAHLERDLGRQHAGDAAVRRGRGAGRDHRGRDLRDLLRLELPSASQALRRLEVRLRVVDERVLEIREGLAACAV